MSTIKRATHFHANHAAMIWDGEEMGLFQNFSANQNAGSDYVYHTGSGKPKEINHNRFGYQIQASGFIPRGRNRRMANKFPIKLGEIDPFDIVFLDQDQGIEWIAKGVEPTGDSMQMNVTARITKNISLMALDILPRDGTGPAIFADVDVTIGILV